MKDCPCEDCISLAICYQSDLLQCEELYHYVCAVDRLHAFVGYRKYSLIVILSIYNRYVSNSSHSDSHKIELVSNIKDVRGMLYEEYI